MNAQFTRLEHITEQIVVALQKLDDNGSVDLQELDGIVTALTRWLKHLYHRYGGYARFEKEVYRMKDTWIDPKVLERGRR